MCPPASVRRSTPASPPTLREVHEQNPKPKTKTAGASPSRSIPARSAPQASCLNTSRAAATVVAMSSSVWAALTKPASYSAGAM